MPRDPGGPRRRSSCSKGLPGATSERLSRQPIFPRSKETSCAPISPAPTSRVRRQHEPRQLHETVSAARDRRRLETACACGSGSLRRRARTERARLREEVVLLNLSVAQAIAGRYRSRGILLDDLQQVACLGLVKAVNGFDPSLERDFLSYAVPTISGEVKRHFRDHGWDGAAAATCPGAAGADPLRHRRLRPVRGQPPGRPEIAARLGVDVSDVIEALTCNGFNPMSLDVPLGEPGSSASLGDLLTLGGNEYDDVENAMVLGTALRSLSSRELLILRRRFCEDRTQQEIGDEIGLSQMQVSRLQARILARLRVLVASPDTSLDLSA